MSLWEACSWTLLRSAVLVALALPVCFPLCRLLSQTAGGQRRLVWVLLLVPLLAPHLVTGYGYSNFELSLIQHPVFNEVLYDLLVLISVVPVGVVLLYFAPPPPLSGEALHCSRLVTRRNAAKRRRGIGGSSASSCRAGLRWVRLLWGWCTDFSNPSRGAYAAHALAGGYNSSPRMGQQHISPGQSDAVKPQAPPWVGQTRIFSALKGRNRDSIVVGSLCRPFRAKGVFAHVSPGRRSTTGVVPLCPGLIGLGPSGRVNRDRTRSVTALQKLLITARAYALGSRLPPPSAVSVFSSLSLFSPLFMLRGWKNATDALQHMDGFWIRGPVRSVVPAVALMFLVAFQEFELASLMGAASWTVWLFDAQAGGLLLSHSLRYALLPLACELTVLVAAGFLSWQGLRLKARCRDAWKPLSSVVRRAAWLYLSISVIVFCVVPWMLVLQSAAPGLRSLAQSFTIAGDIAIGCVFALFAGFTAYLFALWILRRTLSSDIPRSPLAGRLSLHPRWTQWGKGGAACLILPGLLGSLVLGLTILAVFQLPLLHMAYDTPIPWVVASVLFLLPRAAVFLFLLAAVRARESSHIAELLRLSPRPRQKRHALELLWQTRLAMHFWAVVVLCYWAYVDLTTAAILSPTTMVSAPVRLYNLMHYGRSAVLSAMVFATFVIPAMAVFSLTLLRRPWMRFVVR